MCWRSEPNSALRDDFATGVPCSNLTVKVLTDRFSTSKRLVCGIRNKVVLINPSRAKLDFEQIPAAVITETCDHG